MTTSQSPVAALKRQAIKIAKGLKSMERGEAVPHSGDPLGKISASRAKGEITFGVVMDDKIIKVAMPWATIQGTSEAGLVEYILNYMQGNPPVLSS